VSSDYANPSSHYAKSDVHYADPRVPLRESTQCTTPKELREEAREARATDRDAARLACVPDTPSLSSAKSKQANNSHDSTDDPEPSRYCRAHMPYGSSDPCAACKIARINHDKWSDRQRVTRLQMLWDHYDDRQREPYRDRLMPREEPRRIENRPAHEVTSSPPVAAQRDDELPDALSVACPYCNARPGYPCIATSTGRPMRFGERCHPSREDAAREHHRKDTA
jgi:hypothetical protein